MNKNNIAKIKHLRESIADIKLRFDKFINPNDIDNDYRPMEKDEKGVKQIAPADNEDGMMNKPTPLSKKGGSVTYNGSATPKGGTDVDDSAPKVGDKGYTSSDANDDSLEDFIEWVEPLQNEINDLRSMLQSVFIRLDYQSQDFWDYVSRHGQGHLPPIKSASQMANVLKKLGLDKDYIVQPQTIYAADGVVKGMNLKFTKRNA